MVQCQPVAHFGAAGAVCAYYSRCCCGCARGQEYMSMALVCVWQSGFDFLKGPEAIWHEDFTKRQNKCLSVTASWNFQFLEAQPQDFNAPGRVPVWHLHFIYISLLFIFQWEILRHLRGDVCHVVVVMTD